MKYRLLALDLDGTLLNSRKEVTPAVKRALEWVRDRGVHVVLSTGRIVGEAAQPSRRPRTSASCKAGRCRARSAQRWSRRCRAARCA